MPAELQDAQVPPMSVQSLVENAVKHGITPQSGGGESLVTASAENGSLRIEVRDSGPGFDLAVIRAGHGLDSLVERSRCVVRREGTPERFPSRRVLCGRDGCYHAHETARLPGG